MPTAIVAGVLAGKPGNGGNAWSRLSLVEGLRRLGLDVIFIEQLADPTPQATAYFEAIRNEFGLDGHRSEEHTSELQSHLNLVCRLLLEKKKNHIKHACVS